jgi:hypothetical protein
VPELDEPVSADAAPSDAVPSDAVPTDDVSAAEEPSDELAVYPLLDESDAAGALSAGALAPPVDA